MAKDFCMQYAGIMLTVGQQLIMSFPERPILSMYIFCEHFKILHLLLHTYAYTLWSQMTKA